MESTLDSESELVFHTAPWGLYLIPPVLGSYCCYRRLRLLQPSVFMSLLNPYVTDSLYCHLLPENLALLAYGHLAHYYTNYYTKCPLVNE